MQQLRGPTYWHAGALRSTDSFESPSQIFQNVLSVSRNMPIEVQGFAKNGESINMQMRKTSKGHDVRVSQVLTESKHEQRPNCNVGFC